MLERMNDWCNKFLNKLVRYDDLITFTALSILLLCAVSATIIGVLGMLGVWR